MAKRRKATTLADLIRGISTPVFIVKLQKGLADRQRLPLAHVVRVLEEVRYMIEEAGREVLRDKGIDLSKIDFGLELVAGTSGTVFRKGSVQAVIAITNHVQAGATAAKRIVATIDTLNSMKPSSPSEDLDQHIVRRLNRIGQIQRTDKTELRLVFKRPGRSLEKSATFGQDAIDSAWSLQAPIFSVENTNVFGKLFELRDKNPDEDGNKGFWGELRRENGETWRVQFKQKDLDRVVTLFGAQVSVTGTARYYRIAAPKLVAQDISVDRNRDFVAAFEELYGIDKKILDADLPTLIKEIRGED
jgi:hypothetical protein